MSIRAKTKKRLVILVVACAAMVVMAGTGFYARRTWLRKQALAARQLGMEAAAHGDKQAALDQLTLYLHRFPHDADALYQCALARRDLPLPQGGNLTEAIRMLQIAVEINPDLLDAQHALLDLYTQKGFATEAITGADHLLATLPKDPTALRAKALALRSLRRNDEAQVVLEQYLALAPDDFSGQVTNLQLLQANHKPSEQIIAAAKAQLDKHPNDPRFELMLAMACSMTKSPDALAWADKAASHPLPDIQFLNFLLQIYDHTLHFDRSMAVLEKTAPTAPMPIRRIFVQRLWEAHRPDKVLAFLDRSASPATQPAGNETFSADLIGYRALALVDLNRKAEVPALADDLAKHDDDIRAQAWAMFLRNVVLPADIQPRVLLEACRQASSKDSTIPPIHLYMGQAYQGVGENELALHEWQEAAVLSPSWAVPYAYRARLLATLGRFDQALVDSREAWRRAPNNVEVAITLVWVDSLSLDRLAPSQRRQEATNLLKEIGEIQKVVPDDRRLPQLKVELLARIGKTDQAVAALNQILDDSSHPPTNDLLLDLAQLSHKNHLGLEDAIYQRYQKVEGMTPALALATARSLAEQGKPADGRRLLESIRDQQKDPAAQLAWRLMFADYLDQTGDPDALSTLTALADDLPDNFMAQQIVINARSAQADRALLDRSIDRLKAITGEQAVGWRLAQARWLLDSGDIQKDTPAAAAILHELVQVAPNLLDPRVLLAEAMTRQGNRSEAIEQLKAAQTLAPDAPGITLTLAKQLQDQGDSDAAGAQLEKALAGPALAPAFQRQAVELLIQRGEIDRASGILQKLDRDPVHGNAQSPDIQLAKLYILRNQLDEAEAIYRKALTQDKPSPEAIELGATLLAQRGKNADAQAILALLDKPGVAAPDVKELILGRFAQANGQSDLALAHLQKAVELVPTNEGAWRTYLTYLARQGKIQPLLAAAAQAAQALPASNSLTLLNRQADLVGRFAPRMPEMFVPLLVALVDDASHQDQAIEALNLLADSIAANEMSGKVLVRLVPVGERDVQFLPLQVVIIHLQLAMHRWDDAAATAMRAMATSPNLAEPAALAAEALGAAERWDEALTAAQKWRDLSAANPMPADLMIAELDVRLKKPAAARKRLARYLQKALNQPDAFDTVIGVEIQALLAESKQEEASQLIEPLLPKSPRARAIWMDAALIAPDAQTATDWLNQAAVRIPDAQVGELLVLEEHWLRLGIRFHDSSATQQSRQLLEKLAQRPDATVAVLLTLAGRVDDEGDLARAEKLYRQVLQLQPDQAVAQNNLAMVLVRRSNQSGMAVPDEAVTLADAAVITHPGDSMFLDTQATVLDAHKDYAKAAAAERLAMNLDPAKLDWQVSLAKILVDGGQMGEATKIVLQIDSSLSQGGELPASLKPQLDGVRHALAAQSASH